MSSKNSPVDHLLLTQIYRYYLIFQKPYTVERIQHHLDLLSDDIIRTYTDDTVRGKSGIKQRLTLIRNLQHSFYFKNIKIKHYSNGKHQAKVSYHFHDILPDLSEEHYNMVDEFDLQELENEMPLITKVSMLSMEKSMNKQPFKSTYAETRGRSFLHLWLYCMESCNKSADIFKQFLSADFSFQTEDKIINTFTDFSKWLENLLSQYLRSAYIPKDIVAQENEDGSINLKFVLDVDRITLDRKIEMAEIRYQWRLINDPNHKYPRLKELVREKITILESPGIMAERSN